MTRREILFRFASDANRGKKFKCLFSFAIMPAKNETGLLPDMNGREKSQSKGRKKANKQHESSYFALENNLHADSRLSLSYDNFLVLSWGKMRNSSLK